MSYTIIAPEQALALGMDPVRLGKLDGKLGSFIGEHRQCIAIKILRKGIPIFQGTYGKAGAEPDSPEVRLDTIFPVASITKPTIATMLMKLQEDGDITLCAPVSRYLPTFTGEDKAGITIAHLLTHTSGMSDEEMSAGVKTFLTEELKLTLPPEDDSHDDEWDELFVKAREMMGLDPIEDKGKAAHETWEYIRQTKYKVPRKPMQLMSYCNTGYGLCKDIVEKVSGMSVDEYSRTQVFEPLGMMDTRFKLPQDKWNRVVKRSDKCEGFPWQNTEQCLLSDHGAGGLKTTADDIIKFCEMIRNKGTYNGARVLSRLSVETMWRDYNKVLSDKNPYDAWALGFNFSAGKLDDLGMLRSFTCLDHGGYGGTKIVIDGENELSVAIFTVYVNNSQENVYGQVMNILLASII